MPWNWQSNHWSNFTYDAGQLEPLEREYARLLGTVTGAMKHLEEQDNDQIVVQLLSTEGVKTGEITLAIHRSTRAERNLTTNFCEEIGVLRRACAK